MDMMKSCYNRRVSWKGRGFDLRRTKDFCVGRDSSVGITTGYGLDGPGIESRWVRDFSTPVQTGPGAHPASCTMGTGSFPGVKSGQGVTLTPHPLLVPWSWKGRAIPLLPLWAVRPVQSLNACTRVHFYYCNWTEDKKCFEQNLHMYTKTDNTSHMAKIILVCKNAINSP